MELVGLDCNYCGNSFRAESREVNRGNAKFCSLACSCAYGNKLRKKPKSPNVRCVFCQKDIYRKPSSIRGNVYCSKECFYKATHPLYSKNKLISIIQSFYSEYTRIPTYKEFEKDVKYPHPHNYKHHFGSWNQAIEIAGFESNKRLLGYVVTAKDGHICHSFAELMIDDYLFEKGIDHVKEVKYPGSKKKADWLVGNTYIEYFGLDTERDNYISNKYRIKILEKRKLCKNQNLKLLEIYPKHLSILDKHIRDQLIQLIQ